MSEGGLDQALAKPSSADTTRMWVGFPDGDVQDLTPEVAMLSPWMQQEMLHTGCGLSADAPLLLPKQVGSDSLQLIAQYCQFHRAKGRSDKERKQYNEKFIRMDTRRICELTSAADALSMKPLVDLASRALARMIEGKSPEEIRATFHLPDDLTEEEKLEPLSNATDDPRIRLLNRLYAKKRRELAERQQRPALPGTGKNPAPVMDDRPLEDLLSFIEEPGAGKAKGPGKKKKGKGSRQVGAGAAAPPKQHQDRKPGSRRSAPAPAEEQQQQHTSLEIQQLLLERLHLTGGAQQAVPSQPCAPPRAAEAATERDAAAARPAAVSGPGALNWCAGIELPAGTEAAGSDVYHPNQDWEARIAEMLALGDGPSSALRGAAFREPNEPAMQGSASMTAATAAEPAAAPEPVGREDPDAGACSPDLDDDEGPLDVQHGGAHEGRGDASARSSAGAQGLGGRLPEKLKSKRGLVSAGEAPLVAEALRNYIAALGLGKSLRIVTQAAAEECEAAAAVEEEEEEDAQPNQEGFLEEIMLPSGLKLVLGCLDDKDD